MRCTPDGWFMACLPLLLPPTAPSSRRPQTRHDGVPGATSRVRGWRTAMGFVHIDHVGILAYTIDQAEEILGGALGLELDQPRSQWPTGTYFAPEQTYNYFFQVGNGEAQVEVLIPEEGATSGAARFLERRGPGMHHLCYACSDVQA